MANEKTMEDWFLRGGERPKNDGEHAPAGTCQNCGDNLADEEYCTHCGAALTGGTSTGEYCGDDDDGPGLRKFVVTMTRLKTVEQEARVTVMAASEEEAMEEAEDAACEESDGWTWTGDRPATVEYEDCQAEDAGGGGDVKLAVVPHYDGPDNTQCPPAWKLARRDVVDTGGFARAALVTGLASFPNECRGPEPLVRAIFTKGRTWEQYVLPLSEFRQIMNTGLRPDFA